MSQKWFRISTSVIVLTIIVSFTALVSAEEGNFRAKSGFYIGLSGVHNTVESDDFDGETVLVGPSDIILVPDVDDGTGFKIVLGARSSSSAAEISYIKSDHDITFLGASGDGELTLWNLDWKLFFQTKKRVQPFFLLGFNFSEFTAKDSSSDGINVGDAKFKGVGLNAGAGLAYYFNPRAAITAGATYRWITYGRAKGIVGSGDLPEDIVTKGINFDAGLTYTF